MIEINDKCGVKASTCILRENAYDLYFILIYESKFMNLINLVLVFYRKIRMIY
jgi:hypothetical protein